MKSYQTVSSPPQQISVRSADRQRASWETDCTEASRNWTKLQSAEEIIAVIYQKKEVQRQSVW